MNASTHYSEVVGIIGGVGPEATNYFTSLLIKLRGKEAKKDQDHIPFLVFNNPQIPDRTEYFLRKGENPLPELVHTGKLLKKAGATFLVIPCNTAHPFAQAVQNTVKLPVLNMIELTAQYVMDMYGSDVKIGLLATDGTVKSKIYQQTLSHLSKKAKFVLPEKKYQEKVMSAIYSIKSDSVNDHNSHLLYEAAMHLIQNGAQVLILGCTEIPLALKAGSVPFPVIDPMEILASEVVKQTLLSKTMPKSSFFHLFPKKTPNITK